MLTLNTQLKSTTVTMIANMVYYQIIMCLHTYMQNLLKACLNKNRVAVRTAFDDRFDDRLDNRYESIDGHCTCWNMCKYLPSIEYTVQSITLIYIILISVL